MRDVRYCDECGARLNLYVVGVCSRCNFDLTGEDADLDAKAARYGLGAPESPGEGTEV